MEWTIDAYSLLNDYIEIHRALDFYENKYSSLSWDTQVRVQRIFSLLRAYMGTQVMEEYPGDDSITKDLLKFNDNEKTKFVSDFFKFSRYELPQISDSVIEDVITNVDSLQTRPWRDIVKDNYRKKLGSQSYRRDILRLLMKARLNSAQLSNTFSGFLEGAPISFCYQAVKSLYFENLYQSDKKLEDIIVKLLGSSFQRSFTKTELVKNYQYPIFTDDDLFDYTVKNY